MSSSLSGEGDLVVMVQELFRVCCDRRLKDSLDSSQEPEELCSAPGLHKCVLYHELTLAVLVHLHIHPAARLNRPERRQFIKLNIEVNCKVLHMPKIALRLCCIVYRTNLAWS